MNNFFEFFDLFEFFESSNNNEEYTYSNYWQTCIYEMNDSQFYENFRMTRRCMDKLIGIISDTRNIKFIKIKTHMFVYFICHKFTYRK